MKNILIVSENAELTKFMLDTINAIFGDEIDIKCCYTFSNDNPDQMIGLGAKPINVRDKSTVDNIIGLYDLVFSLHCKQIFPKKLVDEVTCINFHPGFNPFNRGWYPQSFSIINGMPAGATIHKMDENVDSGEIIAQKNQN